MNKNILRTALVVCSTAMLASCSLDEYNPLSGDTAEGLAEYSKLYGLEAKCYEPISSQLYTTSDFLTVAELGTDLWITPQNSDNRKQLFYYDGLVPYTNQPWDKAFTQAYSALRNCATVITNAEKAIKEGTDPNLNGIKKLYAEARFLRGFYHLTLTTYYGPITLIQEAYDPNTLAGAADNANSEYLSPKRNTLTEIYTSIIEDMKYAMENLDVTPFEGNRARASKKSAVGMLCRAYVEAAGQGLVSPDGESYWKKAADLASDFVADTEAGGAKYGGYLYSDISDVWASANNRNNKEALFLAPGIDANADSETYKWSSGGKNKLFVCSYWNQKECSDLSKITSDKTNYYYGRTNDGFMAPTKYLVDLYNPSWDKRWENSFQTAFGSFSMNQAGWDNMSYTKQTVTLTPKIAKLYGINVKFGAEKAKIYPYVDCEAKASTSAGSQYTAHIWKKGMTDGDTKTGLMDAKNPYVIDYPVAEDENRIFLYLYKHGDVSEESKNKRVYACVDIDDLYDENGSYLSTSVGNSWASKYGQTNPMWKTFPCLNKFQANYDGVFLGSNLQVKNADVMVMRAAEVYLIAAEAYQKLGEEGKAAEYINKLRKRAARAGVAESEYKLTTASEADVLDEYARELCGEHQRWMVLQRHKSLFMSQLQKGNKRAAEKYRSYMKWRPISQTFLQQINNKEEYGDNGYGTTAKSGLDGFEQ